ncbi:MULTISPECIES: hypothetical protein [Calothrix]|uniref:Uncharacterized protein n=2 Tax=Calothrix TaxID=1186 RepID=A0ABR8A648_9CYAN|nr:MULTISPECIES: hypothetical protein [Calothrix]MBD2195333.1 hypothetical protein [Calothrix parietina FACHB-288]MBD2206315.1 hypothetical protein [Calothrix sp. FACHB-168]MBD2221097.1 hypothetical protein [Calothrix sp. FACHB-1219]MBD2223932.1 hypothetical protein [Calothrix anomala FACHB-343]
MVDLSFSDSTSFSKSALKIILLQGREQGTRETIVQTRAIASLTNDY